MNTLTDRERKAALSVVKSMNLAAAVRDYPAARDRAAGLGLELIQHLPEKYSLRCPVRGWILNVYPCNRRLKPDPNRPLPPWLDVPPGWGLADVVEAAARRTREV